MRSTGNLSSSNDRGYNDCTTLLCVTYLWKSVGVLQLSQVRGKL